MCIASSSRNENVAEKLGNLDGLLVAPGFGHRGVEGKIIAVKYARENKLPFFGICLGMQMAVIEFARHILGWKDAHSTEMDVHTSASGDRPDGRAEKGDDQGWDDAAGRISLCPERG